MKALAYLVALTLILPLLIAEQGWAISTLWAWFLVPLGAPAIGIAAAAGIAVTISAIRMKGARNEPERTTRQSIEYLVGLFIAPVMYVGVGWVVTHFQ